MKTPGQSERDGEGWVLRTDQEMYPLAGASGEHFHQARAQILNGSLASAQQELRKGAVYLQMELSRATEKGKKLLQASIGNLQRLTEIVGQGENNYYQLQNSGFEQIFGKSALALAKHHQLKAQEAWNQKRPKATGQHSKATMLHLRHAWAWLGENLKDASRRVMKEEDRIGMTLTQTQLIQADGTTQALVKGAAWTDEGVESALDGFNKEIGALETAMNTERARASQ